MCIFPFCVATLLDMIQAGRKAGQPSKWKLRDPWTWQILWTRSSYHFWEHVDTLHRGINYIYPAFWELIWKWLIMVLQLCVKGYNYKPVLHLRQIRNQRWIRDPNGKEFCSYGWESQIQWHRIAQEQQLEWVTKWIALRKWNLISLARCWTRWKRLNASQKKLCVELPQFEIETKVEEELMDALRGMGIKDLFSCVLADLSGLSVSPGLFVSNIVQKCHFSVDDKGV